MHIQYIDVERAASAIEADAGVGLPDLRQALEEAKNVFSAGLYAQKPMVSSDEQKPQERGVQPCAHAGEQFT